METGGPSFLHLRLGLGTPDHAAALLPSEYAKDSSCTVNTSSRSAEISARAPSPGCAMAHSQPGTLRTTRKNMCQPPVISHPQLCGHSSNTYRANTNALHAFLLQSYCHVSRGRNCPQQRRRRLPSSTLPAALLRCGALNSLRPSVRVEDIRHYAIFLEL